ncbi:hypothetical protein LJC20_02400 [Eubacteriales bacterium OttesenSCG-928-M02]|nr:hypothetical protein [Eubacteriales bacterium OttesenSCG-928-M02]
MSGPYDDIIDLPHHVSSKHPQMPRENRAAQFAPFAALTGHDAAIKETARLTDRKIELGECDIADLNMKLNMLADMVNEHPEITVTYFRSDEKKEGGAYVSITGTLKRIDDYEHAIVFIDGTVIVIDDIIEIDGEMFIEHLADYYSHPDYL